MPVLSKFLMEEVELKLIPVVADLEDAGYRIDPAHFERLRERLEPEQEKVLKRICKAAGKNFNPRSHDQLRTLLYKRLKVKVTRRTKEGKPSTNNLVLQRAGRKHKVARDIARYRELKKVLSTYVPIAQQAGADGRLRVTFNQLAKTGRFTSPSIIQTLPKDVEFQIRNGFIAAEGHQIVGADFDQQELRVLAQCSGDKKMQAAIAAGVDLHGLAAVKVFRLPCEPGEVKTKYPEKRGQVKAIQFGLIYGASAYSLAETLQIERDEAEQLITDYFKQFLKVKQFIDGAHKRLMRDGHVEDVFGRRRYFPEVKQKLPRKKWQHLTEAERKLARAIAAAKREAQNFLIQGASATITKLAMIRCHEHITAEHPEIRMLLTLHDELQFEVPEPLVAHFAQELPGLMCDLGLEERFGFKVPMKVEVKVGPSWGELKKWEGAKDGTSHTQGTAR
jgi:DNA polymerase-1